MGTCQTEMDTLRRSRRLLNKSNSSSAARGKGNPGSRLSVELHPMKNEMLLALVFESCDVETLKSIRLVCKMWRDVSVKSWRQKAVISLTNRKKMYAKPTTLTLLELKKFVKGDAADRDVLDLPHDILKKPFQNYKFYEFCYSYWLNYRFFLVSFREQIKFLEIPFNMNKTPCIALVDRIILELPNLQELRLKFIWSGEDYIGGYPHIDPSAPQHSSLRCLEVFGEDMESFRWNEFLRIMPNLERLKIGEIGSFSDSIFLLSSIMEAVSSIRRNEAKHLNLTELDIHIEPKRRIPEYVITSMLDCRLPLKRLSINSAEAEKIKLLLESHAKTLESVNVKILAAEDDSYPTSNPLIPMENLRELEIHSGLMSGFTLVASLHAPKIERLMLKEVTMGGWVSLREVDEWKAKREENRILFKEANLLGSSPVIWSKLHTFECDHDWANFPPEKIQLFAIAMPNLKHLSLPLTLKSFREVCASWPKLWTLKMKAVNLEDINVDGQEFQMEDMQIGDEAITGIQKSSRNGSASHPNITNLKELTDFWIDSCLPEDAILTDRSVRHGFLKLNRLHSLKVAFRKISRTTRDLLEAHVPFCQITVME